MIKNLNIYQQRRRKVLDSMRCLSPNSVAYLPTAPEVLRNRDSDYPYRHDSYFYYLTGFDEPESSLVLIAGEVPEQDQAILFCREKNTEREIWDGYRYGPEAACAAFGMDKAYAIQLLDKTLPELIANRSAIFVRLAQIDKLDTALGRWLGDIRLLARKGIYAPVCIHDIEQILDEMRLFKDASELDTMRRAAQISALAHKRAMQVCRPGMREYHLEAELLHTFRSQGAQAVAYNSIVATGANACVLHYRAGDTELRKGELCLIDAGCELDSYASDITRTFPVSGKFSSAQRELYDLVLVAQTAALAVTKPGEYFKRAHEVAVAVLAQGMLDLGLLDSNQVGTLDDVLTNQAYSKFYMHRTGHWLGMDVHDCGAYRGPNIADENNEHEQSWRKLKAGMVLTVEPGIYVRPDASVPERYWNIGIRIEDDVVVTEQGYEVISRDVPVKAEEIEALMARHDVLVAC